MADQPNPLIPPKLPHDLSKFLIQPFDHALATGTRTALKMGVNAQEVINMYLNHLCSVVAMIEPPEVRKVTVEELVKAFGPMVRQHVDFQKTTPGGIIVPNGRQRTLEDGDAPSA